MVDLAWTSRELGADAVTVGYSCPCGCTPAVTYRRGDHLASEGCCCGNQIAVGSDARGHIGERPGYHVQSASVVAPWRETLPVVWAIGPSTHPDQADPGHSLPSGHANDPVCGMTVDISVAETKDLHARHLETTYYFCGKGCKLDFLDEPGRYLAPDYVPSM